MYILTSIGSLTTSTTHPYKIPFIRVKRPNCEGERDTHRIRKMRRKSHPLLRGGRRGESKYSHTFTAAEMQSLGSICETILPSLPSNSLEGEEYQPSNVLQSFCKASGSQTPIPDQVLPLSLSLCVSLSLSLYSQLSSRS